MKNMKNNVEIQKQYIEKYYNEINVKLITIF